MRFRIRTTTPHWRREIRENIAAWIAKKRYPHPVAKETVLLVSEVHSLARTDFPLVLPSRPSPEGVVVTVPADTLNFLAEKIDRAVKQGHLSLPVAKETVSGGTQAEDAFAQTNLPAPQNGSLALDRLSGSLYDLSQVPGISRADALFAPAPSPPGFQNLLVNVTPTPTFAGSQLEVDNYGYAPTGAVLLNATGTVNNAGTPGGLFTVLASTSFGGMNSGTLSYSLPGGLYVRFGGDFSAMNYTLGQGFSPWGRGTNASALAALGVSGSNYSGDLWSGQTLVQAPDRHLLLKEMFFYKAFQDTYSPTVQNDRSLLGGILNLSGWRTSGKLSASFDLSDTEYDLSQGAGSSSQNPFYNSTQGLQNYFTGNAQLQYAFTPQYAVALGTIDQQYIGGGTLDPMLEATLGGVSNVMALPTAALFGNDLYVGTLTGTRTDRFSSGTLATSLFFDAGQIIGIGTDYSAMGPGVEEAWSATHWFARADVALPIGPLPTQALGTEITALTGGHSGEGGVPIQLWLSAGIRY